jgi:hypothetical protein
MSNQIETTITVQLEDRDRKSVALRIFLVVPIAIFVSAFTAWSGSSEASAFLPGLLFLPVVLALVFRGIYPSYILDFNRSLLALSTRVSAYIFLLNDNYPSIEESADVTITFPDVEGGAKLDRYLPLFKWFLAIPLYLVGLVYVIYGLAVWSLLGSRFFSQARCQQLALKCFWASLSFGTEFMDMLSCW